MSQLTVLRDIEEAGKRREPYSSDTDIVKNTLFRDGKLLFTITYILLLGLALYHGLYGLRTMLFELTLKPAIEKTVSVLLLALGLGLFALGTWAAIVAHGIALAEGRG